MIDVTGNMKNVCLFDMDGTLTPARKPITEKTVRLLRDLSTYARVGIVSGSPWEYIDQQLQTLWSSPSGPSPESLVIMPCNGTHVMEWDPQNQAYTTTYNVNFKSHLLSLDKGKERKLYNEYVTHILELQLQFMQEYGFEDLTGNFVSYRGSMLNWSPVGRDAGDMERAAFIKLDKEMGVRNKLREFLRVRLDASGLHETDLNLGGSTSIDIHPTGWDKTHALTHCGDAKVWFVGDKCMPGGNDWSLYEALRQQGRSFSTRDPEQTEQIVREQIIPVIREENKNR